MRCKPDQKQENIYAKQCVHTTKLATKDRQKHIEMEIFNLRHSEKTNKEKEKTKTEPPAPKTKTNKQKQKANKKEANKKIG